eukprot:COSAG06_NODE_2361_length_7004_cov_49.479218_3_plen_933_part_00
MPVPCQEERRRAQLLLAPAPACDVASVSTRINAACCPNGVCAGGGPTDCDSDACVLAMADLKYGPCGQTYTQLAAQVPMLETQWRTCTARRTKAIQRAVSAGCSGPRAPPPPPPPPPGGGHRRAEDDEQDQDQEESPRRRAQAQTQAQTNEGVLQAYVSGCYGTGEGPGMAEGRTCLARGEAMLEVDLSAEGTCDQIGDDVVCGETPGCTFDFDYWMCSVDCAAIPDADCATTEGCKAEPACIAVPQNDWEAPLSECSSIIEDPSTCAGTDGCRFSWMMYGCEQDCGAISDARECAQTDGCTYATCTEESAGFLGGPNDPYSRAQQECMSCCSESFPEDEVCDSFTQMMAMGGEQIDYAECDRCHAQCANENDDLCHLQCDMDCSNMPPCESCHTMCEESSPAGRCGDIWDSVECSATDGCSFNMEWYGCENDRPLGEMSAEDLAIDQCHCDCDSNQCLADPMMDVLQDGGCDSCHMDCETACGADAAAEIPCMVAGNMAPPLDGNSVDPTSGRTYEAQCDGCHGACDTADGLEDRRATAASKKDACERLCPINSPGDKQCLAACKSFDDNFANTGAPVEVDGYDPSMVDMCHQVCDGNEEICHLACDMGPECGGSEDQTSCNDCRDACYSCTDPFTGMPAPGCDADCDANACGIGARSACIPCMDMCMAMPLPDSFMGMPSLPVDEWGCDSPCHEIRDPMMDCMTEACWDQEPVEDWTQTCADTDGCLFNEMLYSCQEDSPANRCAVIWDEGTCEGTQGCTFDYSWGVCSHSSGNMCQCGETTTLAEGTALCEGHGHNQEDCANIGCCDFGQSGLQRICFFYFDEDEDINTCEPDPAFAAPDAGSGRRRSQDSDSPPISRDAAIKRAVAAENRRVATLGAEEGSPSPAPARPEQGDPRPRIAAMAQRVKELRKRAAKYRALRERLTKHRKL